MTIRNPLEWGADQVKQTNIAMESAGRALGAIEANLHSPAPEVRRIGVADLGDALARGVADFAASRSDVVFLCAIYPVIGLLLGRLAFGYEMVPLLFPLASGFALIGPFAAIGLNEMSRRREERGEAGLADALAVVRSPSFAAIAVLGLMLVAIFIAWLFAAETIYEATLGPAPPVSIGAFAHDVLRTPAGWAMIGIGIGIGFLFAVLVLVISAVSFPLLLDRNVGFDTAVSTSARVVARNPGTMALWGLIVAGGLALGSLPLFLGLVVVMPVLGHATWHLYRKAVAR
ncbi:MAG TPA: DUF2189 domain-containing protein [Stellaceae bacterium]|nr:DUF2189 domain-containing protein [Stellaceae bacterium]